MDQDKKGRLILLGSFALIVSLGLTCELVKVPLKTKTVEIKKVPLKISVMQKNKERTDYRINVLNDYKLVIPEDGKPYGYKETTKEEEKSVKLGDYLSEVIHEKIK